MFLHETSKQISTILRVNSGRIKSGLRMAFERSIMGCGSEIQFLDRVSNELNEFLNSISINGLHVSTRTAIIHQKPIVSFEDERCELGDLLIVVKYLFPPGIKEVKSIIYQVKLTERGSTICRIDQKQLRLLRQWPPFYFGRKSEGGTKRYSINPKTLEFGSYMLEAREPKRGDYVFWKAPAYGACPYARIVHECGPERIDIPRLPYTRSDAQNLFSQIVFEIGEHHSDPTVEELIEALYRYVGLSPDPPSEFEDFSTEKGDDGFAVIEINVKARDFPEG